MAAGPVGPRPLLQAPLLAGPRDAKWAQILYTENKAEFIYHEWPWRGVEDVEWATLTYVDWFNHERLHGEIGMVTPAIFEAA